MSLAELEPYESSRPSEDYGRTPPQDVAAEMSVLGGMMLSKDAIADVVEQIRGTDFYRPAHEMVFEAILDLYGRGEPADAITVAGTLTKRGEIGRVGGQSYLHTLISSVPTAANAGYYARIVRERAVLRRLVEAGTKIVQLGYAAEGGDVDALVNTAQAEVYAVTERRTSEDYVPLGSVIEATIDEIEAAGHRGGGMTGVPTGFTDLDQLTNGLHPGQMIVIAARPAIGKSTIGLDIARSASIKNGLASVVFSLEMSKTEITMRLLSAEAKIPLQNMRKGMMREEDWTRMAKTLGQVNEAPLFIDDSPNMTLTEIRAKCRRLKQRHDLRLVVIDYLQLMTSGKRVESRQQEVSEFSRALKLLAKELEVPVIAISQLNRGPEQRTDKRPAMSDLRESGCLTADTRMLRADTGAEVTLGELVASGARDVPLWALNERLQLVPRTMTHAFPSGVRETFRLRLASGREISATANHPFLTMDGWTPLGELAVGDRLGVVRHVPPPLRVSAWVDDEVVLLAHLIGDGSVVRRQPIRYASIDEANLTAVADAAARRFGITAIRDDYAAARVTTLRLPAPYRLARGRRNPIAEWLDGMGLFGLRSYEKFVPEGVFALPKAQVALFLRHLWATDGCVHWHRNQLRAVIYYASTSRRLADDVSALLLRFNIQTRIKTVTKSGYRDTYHVYVMDVENQRRFLADVGCHGARGQIATGVADKIKDVAPRVRRDTVPADVWEKVRAVMTARGVTDEDLARRLRRDHGEVIAPGKPVSRQRMAILAEVLDDADLEVLATNDVYWDEVTSIEALGQREVFDATVLGLHNFVGNLVATHNSIEQDADMVILLHREDAYERESPRAGEADLIVAKHRNGPTDTIVVAFQGHYSRFVDMAAG